MKKFNEIDLIENKNLRKKMMSKVKVLDKVKGLLVLPNTELMTTRMVAEWFSVGQDIIRKVVERNKTEIQENGMEFKKYAEIKTLVNCDNMSRLKISRQGTNVFSKRAVLNIAMLLRDSQVAKRVRTALLDQQEVMSDEQKTIHIDEEKELALKIMYASSKGEMMMAFNEYNTYKNRHIEQLEDKIDKQRPKVESYDAFIDGKNVNKMNSVAKSLGMGRNKLFDFLRVEKVLMSDNLPYQRYINSGYFKVKVTPIDNKGYKKNVSQTYVTAKGIDYINKLLTK